MLWGEVGGEWKWWWHLSNRRSILGSINRVVAVALILRLVVLKQLSGVETVEIRAMKSIKAVPWLVAVKVFSNNYDWGLLH